MQNTRIQTPRTVVGMHIETAINNVDGIDKYNYVGLMPCIIECRQACWLAPVLTSFLLKRLDPMPKGGGSAM